MGPIAPVPSVNAQWVRLIKQMQDLALKVFFALMALTNLTHALVALTVTLQN